ncbi:MAG: DUF4388 domain-containing protein [Chamaesiphon sp.]|nr:DUF4388 domain-containing protein [Chamaesiphon sp.]
MSLAVYLSEYSLAEIFNFIQAGDRTGLLSIESDRCLSRSMDNAYYISFQTGRIMSVSQQIQICGWILKSQNGT